MSKRNRLSGIKERSEVASSNVGFYGGAYRQHKRTQPEPKFAPKSHCDRVGGVLDRLDKAGVRPYTNPEKDSLKRKKILATAVGTIALFAGAYGLGKIAPDGGVPPSPANMTEFKNDPLQPQYDINPDIKIIGGELQQLPSGHLGAEAEG